MIAEPKLVISPEEKEQMDEAMRLCKQGYKRSQIAKLLGKSMTWCHVALAGCSSQEWRLRRHREAIADGKKKLRNPWLDPMDEANVEGYWVPTPQEIAQRTAEIRFAVETGDFSGLDIDQKRLQCPRCGRKLTALRAGLCSPCFKDRYGSPEGSACQAS